MFIWNLCWGVFGDSRGDPNVQEKNRTRMKACVKMFFVMGLSWIAEIINWAVAVAQSGQDEDLNVTKGLFFFDLVNSLQVCT